MVLMKKVLFLCLKSISEVNRPGPTVTLFDGLFLGNGNREPGENSPLIDTLDKIYVFRFQPKISKNFEMAAFLQKKINFSVFYL